MIGQLVLQGLYQAGLGFLGGWYGGYLRRRQTQLSAQQTAGAGGADPEDRHGTCYS